MSHMPSYGSAGTNCDSGCSGAARIVEYTATGAEGTDFMVPVGTTLADDEYEVGLFGTRGVVNVPICDFPNALAGDRTQTEFRVVTAAVLTAGDVLLFQIVEA